MTTELVLPVSARGHVLIESEEHPRAVLVGFHGYGESPDRTLEALRAVRVEGLSRWAPRGLHHFYDRRGNVVASWMTRFDRQAQVEQQVQYLRAILDAIGERHLGRPVFVLGFSQGVATAWRAAVLSGRPVAHLFQLAGDMPPEVADRLPTHPPLGVTMAWGLEDTVVDLATMERDHDRLRRAGWTVELHRVEGGHDYLPAALDLVAGRIRQRLGSTSQETKRRP